MKEKKLIKQTLRVSLIPRKVIIIGALGLFLISAAVTLFYQFTKVPDAQAEITGTWESLPNTPESVWEGGAMVSTNNGDHLYLFRGDNSGVFWRFSISDMSWTTMASTPESVRHGSSMVYPVSGDYIYALRGNNSNNFWRYSTSTNTWEVLTNTPASVWHGGSLVYPGEGDYIYGLRGANTNHFWRYSISENAWTSMTNTPAVVRRGGYLVYPDEGDYLYAFRGEKNRNFWRYSISENTWESLADTPEDIYEGASMEYPGGGDYIYALRGDRDTDLWKYSIQENEWTAIDPTPEYVLRGGDLTYPGTGHYLYAVRGESFSNFWRYGVEELQPVAPLPIELLKFNAKLESRKVTVNWSTAVEIENDYFSIERSSDGLNFEIIGVVNGAGNSTNQLDYVFMDNNPFPGVSYYRLTQTDYDGSFESFHIVAIENNLTHSLEMTVFPNPSPDGRIYSSVTAFDMDTFRNLQLEIYDVRGRMIVNKSVQYNMLMGEMPLVNSGELSPGIYFLNIRNVDINQVERIVIN